MRIYRWGIHWPVQMCKLGRTNKQISTKRLPRQINQSIYRYHVTWMLNGLPNFNQFHVNLPPPVPGTLKMFKKRWSRQAATSWLLQISESQVINGCQHDTVVWARQTLWHLILTQRTTSNILIPFSTNRSYKFLLNKT